MVKMNRNGMEERRETDIIKQERLGVYQTATDNI